MATIPSKFQFSFSTINMFLIFIFLTFFGCTGDPPTSTIDTTSPTPGNSGLILATVTEDSATLTWNAASDNTTTASSLTYKVYYSQSSSNVSSETGLANASSIGDFTADMSSKTVTGLAEATTYYFNVAVKDEEGNMALYEVKDARTTDISSPSISDHVISVSGAPSTTLTLNWTAASDATDLEYQIYQSTSANIDTLENIDNYGGVPLTTATETTAIINDQPLDMDLSLIHI